MGTTSNLVASRYCVCVCAYVLCWCMVWAWNFRATIGVSVRLRVRNVADPIHGLAGSMGTSVSSLVSFLLSLPLRVFLVDLFFHTLSSVALFFWLCGSCHSLRDCVCVCVFAEVATKRMQKYSVRANKVDGRNGKEQHSKKKESEQYSCEWS